VKRSSTVFACILVATLVFWIVVFAIHKHTAHDMARNRLKAVIPAYAAKIEKTVAGLQRETPSESVSNLYYVNDFFNPGPNIEIIPLGIPLPEKADEPFLDAVMSNRRFLKSFSELSKMDNVMASQMVKTNLSCALASYSRLYDLDLRQQVSDCSESLSRKMAQNQMS
jgi:hypothetical protein